MSGKASEGEPAKLVKSVGATVQYSVARYDTIPNQVTFLSRIKRSVASETLCPV